jgi:hypothetical protein
LTRERRSVNLFATDYQLRDGFAEIVLKSKMTGSSAVRWREHGATGLYSTVTARLAGQIAMMQGEFALSIESKTALDVRDLAASAVVASIVATSIMIPNSDRCSAPSEKRSRQRVQAVFQYRAKPVLTGELRFTNERERCADGCDTSHLRSMMGLRNLTRRRNSP